MKQIITHFTDNDLYTFSCQYYVLMKYPRAEVKYSFIDRNNTCYPQNFAALLQEQVDLMPSVKITDEEIAFMTSHCPWLPLWYFNFLRYSCSGKMVLYHHVGNAVAEYHI